MMTSFVIRLCLAAGVFGAVCGLCQVFVFAGFWCLHTDAAFALQALEQYFLTSQFFRVVVSVGQYFSPQTGQVLTSSRQLECGGGLQETGEFLMVCISPCRGSERATRSVRHPQAHRGPLFRPVASSAIPDPSRFPAP